MTPELKTACELVFQEHKLSHQIKWSKAAFRGQLSIGISELAKETLVKKKIIFLPDKSRKIITLLNPAVAAASSFEEAEGIIENKVQVPATNSRKDESIYVHATGSDALRSRLQTGQLITFGADIPVTTTVMKWYLKPLFYYFVLPATAIVAGALISFLLDFAYSEIFLHGRP